MKKLLTKLTLAYLKRKINSKLNRYIELRRLPPKPRLSLFVIFELRALSIDLYKLNRTYKRIEREGLW